eukprot:364906-Chlamydomonas_euryale.AAC.18
MHFCGLRLLERARVLWLSPRELLWSVLALLWLCSWAPPPPFRSRAPPSSLHFARATLLTPLTASRALPLPPKARRRALGLTLFRFLHVCSDKAVVGTDAPSREHAKRAYAAALAARVMGKMERGTWLQFAQFVRALMEMSERLVRRCGSVWCAHGDVGTPGTAVWECVVCTWGGVLRCLAGGAARQPCVLVWKCFWGAGCLVVLLVQLPGCLLLQVWGCGMGRFDAPALLRFAVVWDGGVAPVHARERS